jgi:hypothetical protein
VPGTGTRPAPGTASPPTGGAAPRPVWPPAGNCARPGYGRGRQPIAAQILWRGVGGTRAAYLYRIDLARPKTPATAAQLRAVAAALAARRTCSTCGLPQPYYIPRSLGECLACAYPEPVEEACA